MKTTETATITLQPHDPWGKSPDPRWLSERARQELPAADRAPGAWHALSPAVRTRLAALCERVREDHPDEEILRLAALVRGALRATWCGNDNTGLDCERYTARFAVAEPAARKAWHTVEDAIAGRRIVVETLQRLRALEGLKGQAAA